MKYTFTIGFLIFSAILYSQNVDNNQIQNIKFEYNKTNNDTTLSKQKIEFYDQSTDGAEMIIFRDNNNLIKKISVVYMGETGKLEKEYYLDNGKLIFVFELNQEYNRPYYWDEVKSKENNDNEIFDISKTKKIENRYYFDLEQNLIRWITEKKDIVEEKHVLFSKQKIVLNEFLELQKRIN